MQSKSVESIVGMSKTNADAVAERRLRPIYGNIFVYKNKESVDLRVGESLLESVPDFHSWTDSSMFCCHSLRKNSQSTFPLSSL